MRFKFFLFSLFVTIATCAQNQRGLVRTIGTSSHHGVPVAGATIKVKGNSQQYLSDNKGAFSLSMHSANAGDKFQLLNVTKRGYELADKDFLSKTFAYSNQSLLEIVLLSTEEMEKEKQAIEDRVFKIAKDNYEKKRDGLKHEQEQGLITIEDYRAKLKTLQDQYDTFDEILSAMAEHYARTDYDHLDSLDVLINTHIINGELDEADMLVAQKGNLDDRIAAYGRHAATNAAAREMLDKLTDELRDQRLAYEKERNDIANDLYNKHSIAISRFDFDQALEMLKLRADLDTTNVEAVYDYAEFCFNQNLYRESETYYKICLRAHLKNYNYSYVASLQLCLGELYYKLLKIDIAEYYYKSSIECLETIKDKSDEQFVALATAQECIGVLYNSLGNFSNCEKYYKSSLNITEKLYKKDSDKYLEFYISALNGLGDFYISVNDGRNCAKYRIQAYNIMEKYANQDIDKYLPELSECQVSMARMYAAFQDSENSEYYYRLALENYKKLVLLYPSVYREKLAYTQREFGSLLKNQCNYNGSMEYYKLALENYSLLFEQNPESYRSELAKTQNDFGLSLEECRDYENSERYYLLALDNYEQLYMQGAEIYINHIVLVQNNLAKLYSDRNDYENSVKYNLLALEAYFQLSKTNIKGDYKEDIAWRQFRIGLDYDMLNNFELSEKYLTFALESYESLNIRSTDTYIQKIAEIQEELAGIYGRNKKYTQSLEFYKLALENYKQLSVHNNEISSEIAFCLYSVGVMYYYLEDLDNSELFLIEALDKHEALEENASILFRIWTVKHYLALSYNAKAYYYLNLKNFHSAIITIDKALVLMPEDANFYDTKGEIFLMQGRDNEALEMWKKVLELNPNFLDNYPDGTNLSNGLKKLGLIE